MIVGVACTYYSALFYSLWQELMAIVIAISRKIKSSIPSKFNYSSISVGNYGGDLCLPSFDYGRRRKRKLAGLTMSISLFCVKCIILQNYLHLFLFVVFYFNSN